MNQLTEKRSRWARTWRALTGPVPLPRWLFIVLLAGSFVAFGQLLESTIYRVSDPSTVRIGAGTNARDINPKAAIETQCADAIQRVGHIDEENGGPSPVVTYDGVSYERWRVVPKPGHADRVLLNMSTGEVVCP